MTSSGSCKPIIKPTGCTMELRPYRTCPRCGQMYNTHGTMDGLHRCEQQLRSDAPRQAVSKTNKLDWITFFWLSACAYAVFIRNLNKPDVRLEIHLGVLATGLFLHWVTLSAMVRWIPDPSQSASRHQSATRNRIRQVCDWGTFLLLWGLGLLTQGLLVWGVYAIAAATLPRT